MSGPVPSPFPRPPQRQENPGRWKTRGGRKWRIGTDAEVAWIAGGTFTSLTIAAAIPPVFEAYATVVLPRGGDGQEKHDRAVLALLTEHTADQTWWLGYLDTVPMTSSSPMHQW